ncbi:MAG TPA: FAD:protein FMN transferase [Chloroflexota bacterium]|nr:FAD:protein FMN transferase [Chloroflexota bacterium]
MTSVVQPVQQPDASAIAAVSAPPPHTARFPAMGCEMALSLAAGEDAAAARRLAAGRALVERAEARLSRFRPESELSRLNARAGQPVAVSPLLWQAIAIALDGARRTDGLYDPTILDALEAAGYDRPFAATLDGPAPAAPPGAPGASWRDVRRDAAARTVALPPGLRLDLGGVAKAWTAERVAARLARHGPCLVDAGGDIAVRGCLPGQAGWPIGVADPRQPDADLALLLLRDRGVATSGVDFRRWQRGGQPQHHIIDPRTRRPAATDLLTATVVAADAAEANLHALVALLLGARDGLAYLGRQPGVEALLVRQDGRLLPTAGFDRYVYAWSPR